MSQRVRLLIAVVVLVVLVAAVLGIDALRRSRQSPAAAGEPTVAPGSIPIRLDGKLAGSFSPGDLERLQKVSFTDAEQGKVQEGWLLRDVILLYVRPQALQPASLITVAGTTRKSAQVTWAEADQPENYVMFDLSNQGTLKLVSVLEKLDMRNEWVQDVDSVEIASP